MPENPEKPEGPENTEESVSMALMLEPALTTTAVALELNCAHWNDSVPELVVVMVPFISMYVGTPLAMPIDMASPGVSMVSTNVLVADPLALLWEHLKRLCVPE